MDFRDKIIAREHLAGWREKQGNAGQRVVVTNGCFDVLHAGHVTYLAEARTHGDVLLIGVNDDNGVRELKGADRPLNPEQDRATVLAALESVGAVCVFAGSTATDFLKLARPDVYVKGGDYTLETLNSDERAVVEAAGGRFVFIDFLAGRSTTNVLLRMGASRSAG